MGLVYQEPEKPPNSGCRDWKEVALFNSSQDWTRVNFRSSSYSLGGGNPPWKLEIWKPTCYQSILPKQLTAILGMAALLIRAPTEFEMVGIHLFEPLAAGDVPGKPSTGCKCNSESGLWWGICSWKKLDVYMLNMLTSKHLYIDAPKVN